MMRMTLRKSSVKTPGWSDSISWLESGLWQPGDPSCLKLVLVKRMNQMHYICTHENSDGLLG